MLYAKASISVPRDFAGSAIWKVEALAPRIWAVLGKSRYPISLAAGPYIRASRQQVGILRLLCISCPIHDSRDTYRLPPGNPAHRRAPFSTAGLRRHFHE